MGVAPARTYFIALGGNLGDVRDTFECARDMLEALEHCHVAASSLLYQTPPIGPEDQPDYLNAVVRLESTLSPPSLLQALQRIEQDLGRRRRERWGPRTLDLDIIACENLIMDTPALTIPHAHMHERMFVLRPLCDIAADWHHPKLGRSAKTLLEALLARGEASLARGEVW